MSLGKQRCPPLFRHADVFAHHLNQQNISRSALCHLRLGAYHQMEPVCNMLFGKPCLFDASIRFLYVCVVYGAKVRKKSEICKLFCIIKAIRPQKYDRYVKYGNYHRTENRNAIYDVFDEISVSYGNKKETDSEEPVSSCICLTDYRTFIDNLKAFVGFIDWYKLYRL